MLSGSTPFRRDESMALLWAQLEAEPPPLTERRPDLPPAVDRVIATALAKHPADRYPSCMAFAAALRTACDAGRVSPYAGLSPAPVPAALAADDPPRTSPVPRTDPHWRLPAPVPEARTAPDHRPDGPAPARRQEEPGGGTTTSPAGPVAPAPGPRRDYHAAARPRSRGRRVAALVAALAVIAALAAFGYRELQHHRGGTGSPAAGQTTGTAVSAGDPAQVVRAYFAAINQHRFQLAWTLVGGGTSGQSSGTSFRQFVAGYAKTQHDRVTIVSVSGDTVTARLHALQDDGQVKIYAGTYTVSGDIITGSDVQLTGITS
jgi:hypothetical protein